MKTKCFAVGIILLFVGIAYAPAMAREMSILLWKIGGGCDYSYIMF